MQKMVDQLSSPDLGQPGNGRRGAAGMRAHQAHQAAELFPMLGEQALAELAADIGARGLLCPIALRNGQVIDGRNRLAACEIAGVEPEFVEIEVEDPVAYVVSMNLARRHLNESQRAMVGARMKSMFEEKAKRRQLAAQNNDAGRAVRANLPERDNGRSRDQAAEAVNTSPRSIESASKVLREAVPEIIAAVDAGKMPVSLAVKVAARVEDEQIKIAELVDGGAKPADVIREQRQAERMDRMATIAEGNKDLPVGERTYPLILADPPWRYEHDLSENRAIENHYPTMSLDEICDLPVADIATENALLFLWATSPKLAESMRVIEAWGFFYRTCMVWVKDKIGLGYYVRQQHELLLIAKRGNPPVPNPADRVSSVVTAPRHEHSAKPDEFRRIIEGMYPGVQRLEMFCRDPKEGWDVWGNESTTSGGES